MLDTLTPTDAAGAAALSASFGWPHREADWAFFLGQGKGVAWRDGAALLGTAVCFPLDERHGTVGLVQVAASLQGQGIGRRLMVAAMALAGARSLMLHATAAGAPLYARLGFVPRGVVQQWQGVASGGAGDARPAVAEDLPAILALDQAATGLRRGGVLRALLRESVTHVTGPASAPSGYAMRRRFGRGQLVGPVVAADEAAATGLAAGLLAPGFMRMDIPAHAAGLGRALAAAGLASVEDVQVMVRGDWPAAPGQFGLSSQAMG